jgi:F-type H+-transporting ATPase subunit gamma
MAILRDIKRRISSVRNTAQITRTMEMVAAAKLTRAQGRAEAARPYAAKVRGVLENLAGASQEIEHPFFEKREVERTGLVVVTSDRGLCGGYNANVIRAAEAFMRERDRERVRLVTIGRKGYAYFRRRGYDIPHHYRDFGDQVDVEVCREFTNDIVNLFLEREVDEVYMVYTHFISTASRRVVTEKYLNVEPPGGDEGGNGAGPLHYIFEPDPETIYSSLLPRYVLTVMITVMAESFASEHAARMVAMNSATKNANEMIDRLTLQMNRVRQATITKEIAEIVGGAEALS